MEGGTGSSQAGDALLLPCPALPSRFVVYSKNGNKKKRNETKLDDVDANVDVDPHWIIGFGCGGAVVRRRRRRHPHTAARDEMTRRRHAGEYNTPSNWLAALMQFLSSLLISSLHSTKVKKKGKKWFTLLHCTALHWNCDCIATFLYNIIILISYSSSSFRPRSLHHRHCSTAPLHCVELAQERNKRISTHWTTADTHHSMPLPLPVDTLV